eukprot:6492371-Amphidinium_carterae.2
MDDGSPPPPRTKAGSYDDSVIYGSSASQRAHRGWIAKLLHQLAASVRASRPLFPLSLHAYELQFKQAQVALALQRLRLTPHCARHGGASTDYILQVRDLRSVQRHGRWKSQSSVRRYEKTGRLLRQLQFMPQALRSQIPSMSRRLPQRLQPSS